MMRLVQRFGFTPIFCAPHRNLSASRCSLRDRTKTSVTTQLRVLAVTADQQGQRTTLPLRKITHPFYISPYLEYPLLLGFGLHPLLTATVNYLHEGYLGLAVEPALLLLGGSLVL